MWAAVAGALVLAAGLVGCSESAPETTSGASTAADPTCEGAAALLECARSSTIGDLVPDEPTAATGEPLAIGMVNQENSVAGSYPELSQAAQAAVDFVNENLNGVDGRPIELTVCNTGFSTEESAGCGQELVEAKVPAVLGGIDVFGNSIETLRDNGVPYVGGIPVSGQSVRSENSYQWSGGSWGATVAFAEHAAKKLDAKKVSIVYGDFGSVASSAEAARSVLEGYGVQVQMVPFPILSTDLSPALNAAASSDPDAVFVLVTDTGCKAGFDGLHALGLTAAKFFVGACAAPTIIDSVGTEETDGAIFNVEGPILGDAPDGDGLLYASVIDQYGEPGLDPVGAGTVTFRSFMNLYAILRGIDGAITPESIGKALRATMDEPSFMGHAYTCDGKQFDGLPALCSPQQILARMKNQQLTQITDWIDVGAIYRA